MVTQISGWRTIDPEFLAARYNGGGDAAYVEKISYLPRQAVMRAPILGCLLAFLAGAALADPATTVSPLALAALRHARVLSPHREVDVARDVCSLFIDGKPYQVIDLVEHVRGLQPVRAVRRAILLGPDQAKANELPYFPPAAPVSCTGDVLTFSAPVEVGNTLPEGRTVAFEHGGADARVADSP